MYWSLCCSHENRRGSISLWSEPIMTYKSSVEFSGIHLTTSLQEVLKMDLPIKLVWKYTFKIAATSPRGHWVNTWDSSSPCVLFIPDQISSSRHKGVSESMLVTWRPALWGADDNSSKTAANQEKSSTARGGSRRGKNIARFWKMPLHDLSTIPRRGYVQSYYNMIKYSQYNTDSSPVTLVKG